MDTDTATHYADAYGLDVDDVLDWFAALPTEVQPVIARAFRASLAPRDPDAHRLYEQGMESWAAFTAAETGRVIA